MPEAEEQRRSGWPGSKVKEHPWSGQCFVSLENPHDHLAGIATVLRMGLELWKEPLSTGVALVLGRGQQLGYCWSSVDLVMRAMLALVDGGDNGNRADIRLFRRGGALTLDDSEEEEGIG